MVSRKQRIRVVIDTNVLASFYLSRNPRSASTSIIRAWRDRRLLELVVSPEIVTEYLEVLQHLQVHPSAIERFQQRLETRTTVSWVNLGPRIVASRDPNDNVFLSTAQAGGAAYLVTGDRDLLDLASEHSKTLRFEIVTPARLAAQLATT